MTNDTYSGNRRIYVGPYHIWTYLIRFHGIFQDGAFPNLEYHLFQVIGCFSALIRQIYCDK